MADIAQLGFSADTSELGQAKAALDALVPAARNVDKAADDVSESLERVGDSASRSVGRLNQAATGASIFSQKVQAAANANFSFAGGFDLLTGKNNSTFQAINKNLAVLGKYRTGVDQVGGAIEFTADQTLNFSRQLSDIGVTLASGMNPFMIAIQQGPQLFDILQAAAARSGQTIGAVFRAAAAAIIAALAPFLLFIGAIAAVAGALVGAFALATREINKTSGNVAAGLDLTDKQMKKLKATGVDTGVTMKDTFLGFFDVISDRLKAVFGPSLDWFSKKWTFVLDSITKYGTEAIKLLVGDFVGAYNVIVVVWSRLPGTMGDLAIQMTNGMISAIEWMINKSISGINILIGYANAAAAKVGLPGLSSLGNVSLGQVANPFAGVAEGTRKAAAKGFTDGLADGAKMTDRFFGDVGKAARKRAEKRIIAGAGDPEKGPKNDSAGAKEQTDAEKFADIMKAANGRIASLQAERDALGLTTEAAAKLRFQQELLNDADRNGLKLSPEQIAAIEGRATAFGKLTAEIERFKVIEGIKDKIDQDRISLEQQRNEIGLTGQALTAYRYEQDLLNIAKSKNIELIPQEIAAIRAASIEYAANAEAIMRQREALDNAKEVTRGFFNDLYQNTKKGMSIWDSFANAFMKAIDRMIDKLVSSQIDKLIDGIFNTGASGGGSGGGGGDTVGAIVSIAAKLFGGFAKGGTFGAGVQGFAKGGTFTNSVVTSPTLFKFASGSKFGEMGEAGPEAVIPLKRGSDGSLGVQMHGGSGNRTGPPSITITNQYTLSGAISSQDIVNMNRRAAEQTVEQVKRNLSGWFDTIQRDGAIV